MSIHSAVFYLVSWQKSLHHPDPAFIIQIPLYIAVSLFIESGMYFEHNVKLRLFRCKNFSETAEASLKAVLRALPHGVSIISKDSCQMKFCNPFFYSYVPKQLADEMKKPLKGDDHPFSQKIFTEVVTSEQRAETFGNADDFMLKKYCFKDLINSEHAYEGTKLLQIEHMGVDSEGQILRQNQTEDLALVQISRQEIFCDNSECVMFVIENTKPKAIDVLKPSEKKEAEESEFLFVLQN